MILVSNHLFNLPIVEFISHSLEISCVDLKPKASSLAIVFLTPHIH